MFILDLRWCENWVSPYKLASANKHLKWLFLHFLQESEQKSDLSGQK